MRHRIIFGADHAGFNLKNKLIEEARRLGLDATDANPTFIEGDDYPAIAKKVAREVVRQKENLGVLVCGTGHGVAIAANRVKASRAVVAVTPEQAKIVREHNHANIIAFGGWTMKPALAKKILAAFLRAKPSGAQRHVRRIKQLDEF